MTAKKLYAMFAGGMVKVVEGNHKVYQERHRIIGYHNTDDTIILIETDKGSAFGSYGDYTMLDGIEPTTRCFGAKIGRFNWDDVVMPHSINCCCKCGAPYKNKKEHRTGCK